MLGKKQEQWLVDNLIQNNSSWNVIASAGPFLPFRFHVNSKELGYIGAWDAYPANRERIVKAINKAEAGHPIVLSGDVHSFWAVDGTLSRDHGDRIPVVEFVTSSITANWPEPLARPVTDNLSRNPQVIFYEPDKRGYLLHEVSETQWRTTARAMQDTTDEQSPALSLASVLVSKGKPGFTRIY